MEDCHQRVGDNPGAKGVFDLDCVQLISIMKKIEHSLVGTRINPFAHPLELHLVNLSKKINAGVDFIQTMPVFDLERFKEFISLIKGENLYLLAGVRPIKSWQALQSMSQMVIPENIVQRIKNTPENKQAEEGIKICVEIIKALKQIKGVNGIHIFAHDWEEAVPILVRQANLK
ncbi:MAG: Methylenetetrahydrofolate reductase [Candidatus Methanoperedenaceae archaeon GB50]|nr:MAG: Methylenetetrahydrofolate reductase [Candidatus Methanoperedenaceae archaeon GB50]